jgi:hypothetical protein
VRYNQRIGSPLKRDSIRVHLAGVRTNPDGLWVAQQARQLIWQFEESETNFRCLIRDNDSKYTDAFDTVFESEDIRIVPIPIQAPNANACSERWVRTAREEILDHLRHCSSLLLLPQGCLSTAAIEKIKPPDSQAAVRVYPLANLDDTAKYQILASD